MSSCSCFSTPAPRQPTATLYGEAADGTHRVLDAVEYGEKLTFPEPFRLDLDTGVLPVG